MNIQEMDQKPSRKTEDPRRLYELALESEKKGELQNALRYYRAAIKSDSNFRPALVNLGALYSRSGRADLALGFFQHALSISADDSIYFNLGSESYKLGRLDDARRYLIQSLKISPRMIRAHILLAYIYSTEKQIDKAQNYFQNALKIEPGNRMAILGLAVLLSESERFEEALKVVESSPGHQSDATLRNLRAGLLLKLGKLNESLQDYLELSQHSSRFTSFTDHLKSVREASDREYAKAFVGLDEKIRDRTSRVKARLEARKNRSDVAHTATGEKEELKDLVDLSLMHLFHGDSQKALKFLFQAKKLSSK